MEWISIKDQLPNNNGNVFVCEMDAINDYAYPYNYEEACGMGYYENGAWWHNNDDGLDYGIEDITHWMPLPEQPNL